MYFQTIQSPTINCVRQFNPKQKRRKYLFYRPFTSGPVSKRTRDFLISPARRGTSVTRSGRKGRPARRRPAIAIPSPARRRLLTSLAGVASPQGSGRRAGKRFPAQAFPPAAPFRRKAPTIFPAGCGRGRRMGPVSMQARDFSISPARR